MVNGNRFPGLFRGPIDHKASSVINMISGGSGSDSLTMGSVIALAAQGTGDILPRAVEITATPQGKVTYGVVVGGDIDGIYGDTGVVATTDVNRASNQPGQGLVVVTRGRCLARVSGVILVVGDKLTQSATAGQLEKASASDHVIATALFAKAATDIDIMAVDVNMEGVL